MDFKAILRSILNGGQDNSATRQHVGDINRELAFTEQQIRSLYGDNASVSNASRDDSKAKKGSRGDLRSIIDLTRKYSSKGVSEFEKDKTAEANAAYDALKAVLNSGEPLVVSTTEEKESSNSPKRSTTKIYGSIFDYLSNKSPRGEGQVITGPAEEGATKVTKPTDKGIFEYLRDGDKGREKQEVTEPEAEPEVEEESEEDYVTYTYKPGDTFGQVLLNLGLSDGSNLWGPGGDVEYYTQQMRDQDMLDARGNVKLGIPFRLRRRK